MRFATTASASMDWARGKLQRARDRVAEETDGVTSKRERARIVGGLLAGAVGRGVQSLQDVAVTQAQEVHDQLAHIRHEQKCKTRTKSGYAAAAAPRHLRVEFLSACDLREEQMVKAFATCDAYGAVVVGHRGSTWSATCRRFEAAVTPVIARHRHPRWDATVELPAWHPLEVAEVTVRVMDSHTMGSDKPLGEVRFDLAARSSGAGCFRLRGGGFASVCLRWALSEDPGCGQLPRGDPAFEQALNFWAAHDGNPTQAAQTLVAFFTDCDRERANQLLLQAPLSTLLQADGQTPGELLRSLGSVVPLLEPVAKARLVGALVELIAMSPGANLAAEKDMLFFIIRSARGSDLAKLKQLVDTSGTSLDLMHVVTRAISDGEKQLELLSHFQIEAESIGDPPFHILSDIDMTVWIGRFGNCGPKFPEGPVPGVLPLFRALDCQITFLTARPGVVESQTRLSLWDDLAIPDAAILKGDLTTVIQSLVAKEAARSAMGQKKTDNFFDFASLHPEARFIFFGDSGEGDTDFALRFASTSSKWASDRVALIHDVVDELGVHPKTRTGKRAELQACGVHVFDTYAGAALLLFRSGILSPPLLWAAAQGCHDEFEALPPEDFVSDEAYFTRRRDLVRDLDAVNEALKSAGAEELNITAEREDIPWWRM
eukprot:TRINITY_DN23614_c0_g1_i1.p1 TRINITY_DN23614_c0_g1~~TRINITY_DN23614_c0_g1_i1.p1  ORF type:complete len:659 (+),score=122.26 TRINITY_DN23614_c0_g1_i1:11-1987(+)